MERTECRAVSAMSCSSFSEPHRRVSIIFKCFDEFIDVDLGYDEGSGGRSGSERVVLGYGLTAGKNWESS